MQYSWGEKRQTSSFGDGDGDGDGDLLLSALASCTRTLLPIAAPPSTSMAIDQHIPYPETHDLARSEKAFYPVQIPVSHWQLRHYISTPEQDHLYYASGNEIYCLNTATKKRKHVATLPFEARCTASGYGYVCVGGEDEGHFAAIKLDGSGSGPRTRTLHIDSALPLGSFGPGVRRRAPTVKVERIGEEIVNSISIHRIQDEDAHLDDIVAVLTNNDRTVRIYSLPQGHETKCVDLPFAINHATISPDGQLLVAVGDYNQAYFYRREIFDTPPQIPKPHNRLTSSSVRWERLCKVTLHAQPETTVGYFTTAWSPSGSLVAVGSEGGYITVMDTDILNDSACDSENRDEAIVAVVPGSRADFPSPHPGAIRSMMFSPDPWDLLVWAEDQGRICIGDMRTGLKSRQIIPLETKEETLNKITFDDLPLEDSDPALSYPPSVIPHLDDLEADLIRRYRMSPDNASAVNFATEYIEARRAHRAARQELANRTQADPGGLTAREQQILDTLRTSRQREEARAGGQIPRSVNYTTPDIFTSGPRAPSSTLPAAQSDSARPISEILSSVQDSFPELSRTHAASPGSRNASLDALPSLHALQEGVWESAARSGLSRLTESPSRLPRRRQSVILSPPSSNGGASAPPSAPRRDQPSTREEEAGDVNPWSIVEEQMSATARGPLFEGAARAQAAPPVPAPAERERDRRERIADSLQQGLEEGRRIATAQARVRERWSRSRLGGANGVTMADARRLAAFPEGYDALLRRTQMRGYSGREVGVRTAGLAMSPDGRTLWAACEEGIFEIDVRIKGRMFLPSCELR
ncbi:hypothetical protein AC579_10103 [Pseudocercospora musae]|uniref:DUF2415 domain-containing protein n=1 Tax=Pseudocercospora musae TaxID=113226 RepID=A0A139HSX8_9PEZI|nr:hypothetical protein AC579_10103 [Pseudocercospora musae]